MTRLRPRLAVLEAAATARAAANAPIADEGSARRRIEECLAALAAGLSIPPSPFPREPETPEGIACRARIMARLDRLRG